jgi:hypothetical protein
MTPKQKRPVGITLLAVAFLYIGCLGTIFFPIICLSGGGSTLWKHIVGGVIHSEAVLRVTSYLFSIVFYLFYVAYAVIGFGLWKLRNWARKAILALMEFFAVVSVLALPFFVKPPTLAIAVVIGTALPFAWFAWYLKRPRVCFAFGAWPSTCDGGLPSEPPQGLSKMGKVLVATAIVATFALYCSSLMVAVESMFRSSEIYQMTLKDAQDSPCVATRLGTPLTPGWMSSGDMSEGSDDGSANLSIPVHGPKGKGSLKLEAEKKSGVWKITSLVLVHDSERVQITPPNPTSNCQ